VTCGRERSKLTVTSARTGAVSATTARANTLHWRLHLGLSNDRLGDLSGIATTAWRPTNQITVSSRRLQLTGITPIEFRARGLDLASPPPAGTGTRSRPGYRQPPPSGEFVFAASHVSEDVPSAVIRLEYPDHYNSGFQRSPGVPIRSPASTGSFTTGGRDRPLKATGSPRWSPSSNRISRSDRVPAS